MTAPAFTPGPWSVHPTIDHDVLAGEKHICRATMYDSADYPREETFANARLIAAAPELYEALEVARGEIARIHQLRSALPQIDAALAKARGGHA